MSYTWGNNPSDDLLLSIEWNAVNLGGPIHGQGKTSQNCTQNSGDGIGIRYWIGYGKGRSILKQKPNCKKINITERTLNCESQ